MSLTFPDVERGFGLFGLFGLVGGGSVKSGDCGAWRVYGCANVELHNRITVDGHSYKDKVYLKRVAFSCGRPACPICYKMWAGREAKRIEARLAEASKRLGLVEHIIVSPPKCDRQRLADDLEGYRYKVYDALRVRGVIGGCLIFHGFRFRYKIPYFSPHFHVLGFIKGGYPCRGCKHWCGPESKCDGFEAVTRKFNLSDGFIVELAKDEHGDKGVRVSVRLTARYQLGHATLKTDVPDFRIVTWFGVCSYHALKAPVHVVEHVCPICKHELDLLRYFGHREEVLAFLGSDIVGDFFADFEEGGKCVWGVTERVKRW
jgi:hypothetical protein